ncbi:MAG: L-ribulose-5-phosphate 3-epimerase [Propionibacteriaceae bacterium]|jgi:L-ribulose-5-phosphate 3-epimerase/hexulose-6-phosphate isomerase|nr:L-ribulose-5-phosphate 3-epimerase [Propionibacteriaceae bacterium]
MIRLGIYEKALRRAPWDDFFAQVAQAGFAFTDLSVDETDERAARLGWSDAECDRVRAAAQRHDVQIGGLCLSLHRRVGPGSADPQTRRRAATIFRQGIDRCARLGVPVLQVAGYYAYYEPADPGQRERYVETLAEAARQAALSGVLLGLENVDGHDVTSITQGLGICAEVGSPWLRLYPDIGNLAEQGLDTAGQLRAGAGQMVALHVKDVLPGVPRRVPLGAGVADFTGAFAELSRQRWSGRLMIELWNDDAPDSVQRCLEARRKIEQWLDDAGLEVERRPGGKNDI